MPTLRNPFRKNTAVAPPSHVNASTDSFASSTTSAATDTTSASSQRTTDHSAKSGFSGGIGRPYLSITPFPDVPTRTFSGDSDTALNGTITAIPIAAREKVIDNAGEYKLSVVNDSGVFVPPSPTEKKSFWKKTTTKAASPIDRTSLDEPFTISRESCESYRRSFDISARSPVSETFRTSLDSRSRPSVEFRTRPSFDSSKLSRPVRIEEHTLDQFEDIKLDDPKTKKRGLFSRFGNDHTAAASPPTSAFPFKTGLGLRKDVTLPVNESELRSITEAK
ncbi:hypothetical protein DFH27DRAFT_86930 [Peziza echinospora]|nr:hypothetical protein DFH27DRAFT_86930 [Peziza echinospora]